MSKLYPSVIYHFPNVDKLDHYEYIINRSIGLFYDLQTLCENFEIPLKQFQMINFFVDMELGANGDNEKAKMMMKSPYLEHIDEESFIGWPISCRLGGGNLWRHLLTQEFENVKSKHPRRPSRLLSDDMIALFRSEVKQNTQISNQDAHPNALMQQRMADFLYEKIKE
mgnify:CR=1 FL=1